MSDSTMTGPAGSAMVEDGVRGAVLKGCRGLAPPFQELVHEVVQLSRQAQQRAQRLNRHMYGLRTSILLAALGVCAGIAWLLQSMSFKVNGLSAQDLLGVIADTCDCLVLVPCILTVFFLEVRIKRRRVLADLKVLEAFNDRTYEMQFTQNAHSAEDIEDLIQLLDVCGESKVGLSSRRCIRSEWNRSTQPFLSISTRVMLGDFTRLLRIGIIPAEQTRVIIRV